jgi:dynamin family protein
MPPVRKAVRPGARPGARPGGGPRIIAAREIAALSEAVVLDHQRRDAARRIRTAVKQTEVTPTIVVAGEQGRGKSRLINALLGRPGLVPVDDGGCTGSYVVLGFGNPRFVRVHLTGAEEPVHVGFDELAAWASIERNPGNERGVRFIEVGVGVPALQKLRIIDTPGVGGLDGGHAALTLEAVKHADALLFVVEAGAPFNRQELRFLEEAAHHIDTVIIALSRVDLHPGWEIIARDDATLLDTHAPRFASAPFVAVSSALSERAAGLEPGPDRRSLNLESGIPRLRELLSAALVGRADVHRVGGIIRTCEVELEAVEEGLVGELATLSGAAEVRTALEAEQARLAAFARESAQWRVTLETSVRRLTLERSADLRKGLAEINVRFTEAVLKARGQRDIEALPSQVMSEVSALALRISDESAQRMQEVALGIVGELEASPALADAIRGAASNSLQDAGEPVLPPPRATTASDRLHVMTSFLTGHSIALAIPALGIAIGGAPIAMLSIGIGVAFSFVLTRGKGDAARRQEFRGWLAKQMVAAQTQLTNEFARYLVDIRGEIRTVVSERIDEQRAEISDRLADLRHTASDAAAARRRRTAAIQGQLARIRGLLARCAAVRRQLASARPVTADA